MALQDLFYLKQKSISEGEDFGSFVHCERDSNYNILLSVANMKKGISFAQFDREEFLTFADEVEKVKNELIRINNLINT